MPKPSKVRRLDSPAAWAREYVRRGWALTQVTPPNPTDPTAGKAPAIQAWQKPQNWVITDEAATRLFQQRDMPFGLPLQYNIGLVHQGSRTLALDIDHLELAHRFFDAAGLDLKALLGSTAQITRRQDAGPRQRAKGLFELPPDVDPPGYAAVTFEEDGQAVTVFELRSGKGRHDVLPPSLHPTLVPYEWIGYDDPGVAQAPEALLSLYDEVKAIAKRLGPGWKASRAGARQTPLADATQTPWQPGPIDRLVLAEVGDWKEVLRLSGLYEEAGERFRHVGSTSAHGVSALPDGRVWSHHVSDPMYRGLGQTPLTVGELYARLLHHTEGQPPAAWMLDAQRALTAKRQLSAASAAAEPWGEGEDAEPAAETDAGQAPGDLDTPGPQPLPEGHPLALQDHAWEWPTKADPWEWAEVPDTIRRGKQDYAVSSERNICLMLLNHPELYGIYRYDEFTQAVYVVHAPYDPQPVVRQLRNYESLALLGWLQRYPEFKDFRGREMVDQAIERVARERFSVDALVGHVRGAGSWDGRLRLDAWLSDHCQVADTPLTRAIGRRFMVGLVARALRPGCKHDSMLILEGAQGAGKSTLGQLLAGTLDFGTGARFPLCSAKHLDLSRSDEAASENIQRVWLKEFGELSTLRNAEREILKNFLSEQHDHYRTKYDRHATAKPRRVAWLGSTNESVYLDDPTGHRRFWPVRVGQIRLDALLKARGQLLAEAVQAFDDGEPWWFEAGDPLAAELAAETGQRQHHDERFDGLVSQLPAYVEGLLQAAAKEPPTGLYPMDGDKLAAPVALRNHELLRLAGLEPTRSASTALGHYMLSQLGWGRVLFKDPGLRMWPRGWAPSQAWLDAHGLGESLPAKHGKKKF